MLRRRIEKLERQRPLAAGDLIERWEQVAISSLSREEQALVAEFDTASRKKPADSPAHISAMESYQDALTAAIGNVTDEELDRMILRLESEQVEAKVCS